MLERHGNLRPQDVYEIEDASAHRLIQIGKAVEYKAEDDPTDLILQKLDRLDDRMGRIETAMSRMGSVRKSTAKSKPTKKSADDSQD